MMLQEATILSKHFIKTSLINFININKHSYINNTTITMHNNNSNNNTVLP